ncbi:cyclic nucleotide-binding domain-containing protein [bacterium]|nr:cyclic nucleotide-binding domain-containing protein [bacterium]
MINRLRAEKIFWQMLGKWIGGSADVERLEFLRSLPFFKDLTFWQLRRISEVMFERSYDSGEVLFSQGQPGAALFVLVEGAVEIDLFEEGTHVILARLEKGHFFGELALLDDSPRSASAKALKPTKALALYRTDLNRMIQVDPHASSLIFRSLATLVGDRLKKTNELIKVADTEVRSEVKVAS